MVICVTTQGGERIEARARIRAAVREVLSQLLYCAVDLHTSPGQAPVVLIDGAPSPIGLSISHAGDLSVAALNPAGSVGIDLMDVQIVSDWARVAHDYLGMAVACRLAALSDAERPQALAQAWAEREARLKLAGLHLSEWTSPLDECCVLPLELPAGFAGALAVPC